MGFLCTVFLLKIHEKLPRYYSSGYYQSSWVLSKIHISSSDILSDMVLDQFLIAAIKSDFQLNHSVTGIHTDASALYLDYLAA